MFQAVTNCQNGFKHNFWALMRMKALVPPSCFLLVPCMAFCKIGPMDFYSTKKIRCLVSFISANSLYLQYYSSGFWLPLRAILLSLAECPGNYWQWFSLQNWNAFSRDRKPMNKQWACARVNKCGSWAAVRNVSLSVCRAKLLPAIAIKPSHKAVFPLSKTDSMKEGC